MIRNLWGPQDVADYLGVPISTVYYWRSRGGGPPGRRVGKRLRYKPDDVEAWFGALPEEVC